jgi:hypothetical protein
MLLAAVGESIGGRDASIAQAFAGPHVHPSQHLLDRRGTDYLGHRDGGRRHMCDQVGPVLVTVPMWDPPVTPATAHVMAVRDE